MYHSFYFPNIIFFHEIEFSFPYVVGFGFMWKFSEINRGIGIENIVVNIIFPFQRNWVKNVLLVIAWSIRMAWHVAQE